MGGHAVARARVEPGAVLPHGGGGGDDEEERVSWPARERGLVGHAATLRTRSDDRT